MIVFNGWLTIASDSEELDVFAVNEQLVRETEGILQKFKEQNHFCEIKKLNGNINLFLGGAHNHDNGYSDDLVEILEQICKIAPETFGIIHIRWPEHEELWNQYKVYRVGRGKITLMDDVYLSPCRPVIEE